MREKNKKLMEWYFSRLLIWQDSLKFTDLLFHNKDPPTII